MGLITLMFHEIFLKPCQKYNRESVIVLSGIWLPVWDFANKRRVLIHWPKMNIIGPCLFEHSLNNHRDNNHWSLSGIIDRFYVPSMGLRALTMVNEGKQSSWSKLIFWDLQYNNDSLNHYTNPLDQIFVIQMSYGKH